MAIVPGMQLASMRSFPPLAARPHELADLGFAKVEPYDALACDAGALVGMIMQACLAIPGIHARVSAPTCELSSAWPTCRGATSS
jgi:hypothetical protein